MGLGANQKAQALTPEILDKIEEWMDEGNYEKTVYQALQINPRTWENWKNKGRTMLSEIEEGTLDPSTLDEGDHKVMRLVQICKKGRAVAVQESLRNIRQAGRDPAHWQANAWYLERVEPEQFGRKTRLEHTGAGGGPIVTAELTEEDREHFRQNLAAFFPGIVDESDEG